MKASNSEICPPEVFSQCATTLHVGLSAVEYCDFVGARVGLSLVGFCGSGTQCSCWLLIWHGVSACGSPATARLTFHLLFVFVANQIHL